MRKWILLVALFLAQGVQAEWSDGNNLLTECQSSDVFYKGVCGGYIIGVVDMSDGKTWDGYSYCLPDVSIGQLKKIVIKHLNDHPEKLHLSASSLINFALTSAFPCED